MHGYTLSARAVRRVGSTLSDDPILACCQPRIRQCGAASITRLWRDVLDELLKRARPKEIVISTFGVREGLLYEALDAETSEQDPLLVAAAKLNRLLSRSAGFRRRFGPLDR